MLEQQQLAYRVQGVDETEPAMDLRKRKAAETREVSYQCDPRRKAQLMGN